jgi:hypothetical protein
MADYDEVEQALLDAIKSLTDGAAGGHNAAVTLKYAAAANQLAEAYAWLNSPNSSHGAAPSLGD